MAAVSVVRDSAKMFPASESCSVCWDVVGDSGERSIAKLKCGHHFHLDCIGSAFNAKGAMQCPNCRHVEDGEWLFANGLRWDDDFPFEEIAYEDEYEVYQTMAAQDSNHLEWCPYQHGNLAQSGSSYEHVQFHLPLREFDGPARILPELVVNVSYNFNESGHVANSPPVCPFDTRARFSQGTEDTRLRQQMAGGPTRPLDPSDASNSGSPLGSSTGDGELFDSLSSIWGPHGDDLNSPSMHRAMADTSFFTDQIRATTTPDSSFLPPRNRQLYADTGLGPSAASPTERVYPWSGTERANSQGHSLRGTIFPQEGHIDLYAIGGGLPVGPCPRAQFTHGQLGTSQSQPQGSSLRTAPIGSNRRSRQNGMTAPSMSGGRIDHSHNLTNEEPRWRDSWTDYSRNLTTAEEARRRESLIDHSRNLTTEELRRRESWTDISLAIRRELPLVGLESHGSGYQSGVPGFYPWRRENTSRPSSSWSPGQLWYPPDRLSSGLQSNDRLSRSEYIEGHGSSHHNHRSDLEQYRRGLFSSFVLDTETPLDRTSAQIHQHNLPTPSTRWCT